MLFGTKNALNSVIRDKAVACYTLGCKLNFAETSTLMTQLRELGAHPVRRDETADICLVNTCSVTEVADHKGRQAIHRLVRQHPGAVVIVTGCYAQLQPEEVAAMEGVDLVLGADEKGLLPEYLAERLAMTAEERRARMHEYRQVQHKEIRRFMPSCSCGERTRYFLKVQDGCDYFCTYCTIPMARGRSRNGSIAQLVAQVEEAAAQGAREVVITGVNIGDFGKTTGEDFLGLARALDNIQGVQRYRISSIEPNLLTDEVLLFCAQSRAFMPHFHIPLQSGSDEVLRLMHRRYDTALFHHKVERIRELMPDAFVGVDVIVGTRGETEEFFEETYKFLSNLPVSQLHVFSYSERPGTAALRIPHSVTPQEKHRRSSLLLAMSNEKTDLFYRKYEGRRRPVLLERSKVRGHLSGFTDNYIKIDITADEGLRDNEVVSLCLGGWNADHTALTAHL